MVETDWRPSGSSWPALGVCWVDLHPVVVDEAGHGSQADLDGGYFCYPPDAFSAGYLGGIEVPCLSREQQLRFRRGYRPRAVDRHDLGLLEPDRTLSAVGP